MFYHIALFRSHFNSVFITELPHDQEGCFCDDIELGDNDSDMQQVIHIHERCCCCCCCLSCLCCSCSCCWCPLYRDSPNPQEQEASVWGLYLEINQPILCSSSGVRARVQRDDSYLKNIMLAQSHLFTRSAGHRLISSIHHLLPEASRKSNYKKKKKLHKLRAHFPAAIIH